MLFFLPPTVGLAQMLKGGVIMDVVNEEQARIAEEAGAVAGALRRRGTRVESGCVAADAPLPLYNCGGCAAADGDAPSAAPQSWPSSVCLRTFARMEALRA